MMNKRILTFVMAGSLLFGGVVTSCSEQKKEVNSEDLQRMVDEAAEKKVTEMKKEQEMQDKLDKAEAIIAADEAKKEKAEKAKAAEEQAAASLRPAQINDPDGYTNVRKGASSSAAVVGVIYVGDVFYVRSIANSNWVEVYLSKDAPRMGYMHRSRVKLL